MNYTEEDIRNAFKAGLTKGNHKSYFDAPLDEDEYVAELKQVKNNFALADVSGRSELLLAFAKFIDADCDLLGTGYIEEMVKKFEASNSH